MTPDPFPLHFPPDQPRTSFRQRAQFKVSFAQARDDLFAELDKLGAVKVTLSTNVTLRRDGLPYSNQKEPSDPGVALYFDWNRRSYCLACDKWDLTKDNIRAIGLHIAALRGQERWGVGTIEQAFAGYQALPSSDKEWWEVLRVSKDATWEEIKVAYRQQATTHHPDKGGDRALWDRLEKAYQTASQEVKR